MSSKSVQAVEVVSRTIPTTMQALELQSYDGHLDSLRLVEQSVPQPGAKSGFGSDRGRPGQSVRSGLFAGSLRPQKSPAGRAGPGR